MARTLVDKLARLWMRELSFRPRSSAPSRPPILPSRPTKRSRPCPNSACVRSWRTVPL